MSKFSIGDRVKVRDYDAIPEEYRSRGLAKMCGEVGTIEDVFYSSAQECDLYVIKFDNFEKSQTLYQEELLEEVDESVTYDYEFEFLENLVVARLYEVHEDGSKIEIEKGHGHVFHDGVEGIAQAASYAMKRLYHKIAGMED